MNHWGVEWHSVNKIDGDSRFLIWRKGMPVIFHTRQEARVWIKTYFGFIAERPDLQQEPHGWRMPKPVKVEIIVRKIE